MAIKKQLANRTRRLNRRRKIQLEQLETRRLLAADVGQFRHNAVEPTDVNNDAFVSPIDALTIVNELNGPVEQSASAIESRNSGDQRFLDVNNDGSLSPVDALMVINRINQRRAPVEGRSVTDNPNRPGGSRPDRVDRNEPEPGEIEFRSIDGSGNNLENPEWGSTGELFDRWINDEYADGVSEPAGEDQPSAREVSNIVNAAAEATENAHGLSDLTWLFGQFIDHDITLTADGSGEAFDITVPTGDPAFDPFGTGEAVIHLERSDFSEDGESTRQQYNLITAFIDGSVIYGSDSERAEALRTFEAGQLKTSEGDLLPFNEAGLTNAGGDSDALFLAGDIRANENAALVAMHTVWVREHNRVAQRIAQNDPDLSDEEIYQRARQYVSAELQAITYNEFLPALLGHGALERYDGYDSTVNPNLSNVFSTAAYRFGHTMLSSDLLRLNSDGSVAEEGNLPLQSAFFNVDAITNNGIDSLLLGASAQTAQEVDPFLVDDVRNFLFGPPGAGGFDLASLNIQRGRDHGLADYNQVREEMGLERVTSFAEISSDPDVQARLTEAYGNVDSIDAWVGMLAEDHVDGSTLGITARTIIAEQFQAIRDGDRFYYENMFGGEQLRKIRNTTLADVIERNTEIEFAREQNLFFAQDPADILLADGDLDRLAREQLAHTAPPVASDGEGDRMRRRNTSPESKIPQTAGIMGINDPLV